MSNGLLHPSLRALAGRVARLRDATLAHRLPDPAAGARRALRLGADLLGQLLPRACLLCEAPCADAPLCNPCATFLPGAGRPRCRSCARPWSASDRCATCREAPPAFARTVAAADYVPPL